MPILRDICQRARAAIPLDEDGARKFFEDNFRPLRITKLGDTEGFLTGYYEPIIDGSRVPTAEFTAPLYRRPPNLVVSGRRKLGDNFPSKGVTVGRRVGRRKIVPFYDRGEIEDGALDGWHLEICYLRDQMDVLFAQIQGSARIRLEDGTILRVNYNSHNGWPYTPVGRVLIDRKLVPKEEMSMQRIREWMLANPDQAQELRRQNKSYVFFRITDLSEQDEAVGGEGVPLMAGRSIAVDRSLHAYGTPFFIEADLPIANSKTPVKFHRLVIAQDTGSAIVGPARADIYFGAGDEAAQMAGRIRNAGHVRHAGAARARSGRSRARYAAAVAAAGRSRHRETRFRSHARSDRSRCADAGSEGRCRARAAATPRPTPPQPSPPQNRNRGTRSDEPAPLRDRGRARALGERHALDRAAAAARAPARCAFDRPCRAGIESHAQSCAAPSSRRPMSHRPSRLRRRSRRSAGG